MTKLEKRIKRFKPNLDLNALKLAVLEARLNTLITQIRYQEYRGAKDTVDSIENLDLQIYWPTIKPIRLIKTL